MANRSATWFRNVAIGSLALSLALIWPVEMLQHGELSLWLHIPLMTVLLNLMAGGAIAAGMAWLEFRARSVGHGQQAQ